LDKHWRRPNLYLYGGLTKDAIKLAMKQLNMNDDIPMDALFLFFDNSESLYLGGNDGLLVWFLRRV